MTCASPSSDAGFLRDAVDIAAVLGAEAGALATRGAVPLGPAPALLAPAQQAGSGPVMPYCSSCITCRITVRYHMRVRTVLLHVPYHM